MNFLKEERMIRSIDEYLGELGNAMRGCDIATRQDALNDAEDHLRSALAEELEKHPGTPEPDLLDRIIGEYGSPRETAESYSELERRFSSPSKRRKTGGRMKGRGFFAIFADHSAWSSALFSLLSLATGIIFFTWAVTGLSLSVSMMILIIGIPVAVGFFFSFHGLAFLEGRIVEGLLDIRMPRRRRFFEDDMSWGAKIKRLLLHKDSWLYILYFILKLPIGIIAFTLTVTVLSVSVSLIVSPLVGPVLESPVIDLGPVEYGIPVWTLPLFTVAGVLLLKGSLHLLKAFGRAQGKFAKLMLVHE